MAWTDLLVVGIILIFTFIGFKTGLVLTLFRFVSMILSFFIAMQLYPILSKFLIGTPVFTWIRDAIAGPVKEKLGVLKSGTIQAGLDKLGIPQFVGNLIKNNFSDNTSNKIVKDVGSAISNVLAEFAIKILAIVLVFVLVFIILQLFKIVLKQIVKLPVIKQVDRIAGSAFGILTGCLIAYLVCAVILIFGNSLATGMQKDVDKSLLSKYFVKNNYIVGLLNKK